MNTVFLLMAEYRSATIPLGEVAKRYLGLDEKSARARAARAELPFPAFRAESQKAPWMVSVEDLASWLDRERIRAESDWKKKNTS